MQRILIAPIIAFVTFLITAFVLFQTDNASAQSLEWQVYPAGTIAVVGHTFQPNDMTEGRLFAGFNITNRRDWGVQDDESGHGYGGGVDINRALPALGDRWFVGGRVDLWSMKINWRNDVLAITADSRILVFQPTARVVYRLRFPQESGLKTIDMTASLGLEKNIATHGQPVGEGAILLIGLRLAL